MTTGRDEGGVTLVVFGAGNRGREVYADYCARHPDDVGVTAVAEPDEGRRHALGDTHGIRPERRFADWRELLDRPKLADGVVIATPDGEHVDPAVAALERGYDILLEKPIGRTPAEIARLAAAAARHPGAVTVAHVLRYTPFFRTVRRLLGEIGQLTTITHTENIGYWHFAHSYVRGNWRRTDVASPMILAKACHDLDLLRWFAGAPCAAVASFGELTHFRQENAPDGAPTHCLDGCPIEESCPFHAGRFYVDQLADWNGPPATIVTDDLSREGRLRALADGPYGRCVYRCDNDVADHQVTNLRFANGITAALTVTAFTEENTRTVRYLGSHGEIRGHLGRGEIELRRFLPAPHLGRPSGAPAAATSPSTTPGAERAMREIIEVPAEPSHAQPDVPPFGAFLGHAGGDDGLMRAFVQRVRRRRRGEVIPDALTSVEESLESHEMAFAADRSRRRDIVVELPRAGGVVSGGTETGGDGPRS